MEKTARVIEVFSSIQGEGIYLGRQHLFVRFWNCNMACHYCDTDYRGPFAEYTAEGLLAEVERRITQGGPFHAVSLTGGEPLLWWKFLQIWLPELKRLNQTVYLETNGTLPEPLGVLLPWIDIVAMDVKPPSATADRAVWSEHEEFLRKVWGTGEGRPEVFVKMVVTPDTSDQELRRAAALIASVDRQIPLVLQPVTPWGAVEGRPSEVQLFQWKRMACGDLADVRILPQVHRILGVR